MPGFADVYVHPEWETKEENEREKEKRGKGRGRREWGPLYRLSQPPPSPLPRPRQYPSRKIVPRWATNKNHEHIPRIGGISKCETRRKQDSGFARISASNSLIAFPYMYPRTPRKISQMTSGGLIMKACRFAGMFDGTSTLVDTMKRRKNPLQTSRVITSHPSVSLAAPAATSLKHTKRAWIGYEDGS